MLHGPEGTGDEGDEVRRKEEEEEEEEGMLGGFFSKRTHRAPDFEVRDVFGEGRAVSIAQESRMHLGGRVWGASVYMLRYFSRCYSLPSPSSSSSSADRFRWQRPVLLEMGAGTGLLGIGMAMASGVREVRLTDKADLLPQIDANVDRNLTSDMKIKSRDGPDAKAKAMELDWMKWEDEAYWRGGGAGHRAAVGVDVVLAADCIYFSALYRPFLATLKRICQTAHAEPSSSSSSSSSRREPVVCYLCNDDGRTAQNRSSDASDGTLVHGLMKKESS